LESGRNFDLAQRLEAHAMVRRADRSLREPLGVDRDVVRLAAPARRFADRLDQKARAADRRFAVVYVNELGEVGTKRLAIIDEASGY
jgi:uncharacterized protein YigA (DUF484 family)